MYYFYEFVRIDYGIDLRIFNSCSYIYFGNFYIYGGYIMFWLIMIIYVF